MNYFDPLDDEDLANIEESNRIIRERLAKERAEAEAKRREEAQLRGKITDWMRGQGWPNVSVRILPKGYYQPPSVRAKRKVVEIDTTPKVGELRFWRGFPPACAEDLDSLRDAGRELIAEFGSFDAALALCASETRSRWSRVTDGYNGNQGQEQEPWAALLARGLTAIRSEARYRNGLNKS